MLKTITARPKFYPSIKLNKRKSLPDFSLNFVCDAGIIVLNSHLTSWCFALNGVRNKQVFKQTSRDFATTHSNKIVIDFGKQKHNNSQEINSSTITISFLIKSLEVFCFCFSKKTMNLSSEYND